MSVTFLTNEDKLELEQKIKTNADAASKLSEEINHISYKQLPSDMWEKSNTTLTAIKSIKSLYNTSTCSNDGDTLTINVESGCTDAFIIVFDEPIKLKDSDYAYLVFNNREVYGSVATLSMLDKELNEIISTKQYITADSTFWRIINANDIDIYGIRLVIPVEGYSKTVTMFIGLGSSTSVPEYEPKYISKVLTKDNHYSFWRGKKILSYGDSQTGQNKWQPYVAEYLGMTSIVCGYGGYPIAQANSNNFGWCLSSEYMLTKLDDKIDENNPDIVTIMGLTNDFNYDGTIEGMNNITIGENVSTDLKTVKGALKAIVSHLSSKYPTLTIVLMSPCGGYTKVSGGNLTEPLVNANGHTFGDYAKAVKEIAEWLGVPFIDVYGCGITIYNSASYIEDGTHMNGNGAKKVANAVINGLKNIEPIIE